MWNRVMLAAVLLAFIGCASPLRPHQRHDLLDALDQAVHERLYDASLLPDAWLAPARELADDSEPSWTHDRRMASAINGCMRAVASHSHVHSPPQAEQGGLRIPWVTTADGVSVLYAVESEGGARIVPGELILKADDAATMRRSVEGPLACPVTLTIRGLDGKEHTLTWKRSAGAPSRAVTSRTLPDGSHYLKIDSFSGSGPFDQGNFSAIERHLQASADARGLVLDLRGNPGGGRAAMDTAALFFDGKRTFAAFLCRDHNRAGSDGTEALAGIRRVRPELSLVPWVSIGRILTFFEVMRGQQSFAIELTGKGTFAHRPVVVLIDEGTRSAAEMLASFLREQCGATLIGRHSGGECAMPASVRLPATDWSAHVATCFVATGTGVLIEGRGLAPDIPVTHRREDLAIGRDADIEHAIDYLHSLRSGRAD